DEQPLYTVDGAVVEEAVVRELAAREIATIEILKGAAAARAGEDGRRPLIQIRTVTAEASDQAVERVPAAAIERSSVLERRREVERRVQLRIEEVPVSGADRPRLLIDGVPATGSSVLRELS